MTTTSPKGSLNMHFVSNPGVDGALSRGVNECFWALPCRWVFIRVRGTEGQLFALGCRLWAEGEVGLQLTQWPQFPPVQARTIFSSP